MATRPSPRHRRKTGGRRGGPGTPTVATGRSRLQKLLAASGIASRRASEAFLRDGRVTVNGETAKLGDSADPSIDRIELDGERLALQPLGYWMMHKPKGVLTTRSDPEHRRTVLDLLPRAAQHLFPVGRLDRDTEGLVLFTNDGPMAHTLLHPSLGNEREYRVTVRGALKAATVRRIERGVHLEEGRTGRAQVADVRVDTESDQTTFQLIIGEGRKRQIRRMMWSLRHPVRQLVRVRMGSLKLGRLAPGEARALRADEVRALRAHVQKLAGERSAQAPPTRGRRASRASQKPTRKPKS